MPARPNRRLYFAGARGNPGPLTNPLSEALAPVPGAMVRRSTSDGPGVRAKLRTEYRISRRRESNLRYPANWSAAVADLPGGFVTSRWAGALEAALMPDTGDDRGIRSKAGLGSFRWPGDDPAFTPSCQAAGLGSLHSDARCVPKRLSTSGQRSSIFGRHAREEIIFGIFSSSWAGSVAGKSRCRC
jgi:hypothetical protein